MKSLNKLQITIILFSVLLFVLLYFANKTPETKEILQADMTVYMKSNQIFQIRFPNKDIKVRVKPLTSTTF